MLEEKKEKKTFLWLAYNTSKSQFHEIHNKMYLPFEKKRRRFFK